MRHLVQNTFSNLEYSVEARNPSDWNSRGILCSQGVLDL